MNSPHIMNRLEAPKGLALRLANSQLSSRDIIVNLYLAALSRKPSEDEVKLMLEAFVESKSDRATATQDVLWALLNSKQFIFNR